MLFGEFRDLVEWVVARRSARGRGPNLCGLVPRLELVLRAPHRHGLGGRAGVDLFDREEKYIHGKVVNALQCVLERPAISAVRALEDCDFSCTRTFDPFERPFEREAPEGNHIDLFEPDVGEILVGIDVKNRSAKKVAAISRDVNNPAVNRGFEHARNRCFRNPQG